MARQFVPRAVLKPAQDPPNLVKFIPFDSARKMSEATASGIDGESVQVVKGAFGTVMAF